MTYPTKKLGEVCDVFTDGNWIETKDQSSSGIRLIQTGNIGQGTFLNKEGRSRFITEQTFKRLNCTEIFPGDLLISRLPDPVGRACIVPDIGIRMVTAVDCTIIRVNKKKILRDFLLYYTNSTEYHNQIKNHLSGTTRQRISRGNLSKIEIPLPPLEAQKEIVAKLENLLTKISEAKKLRAKVRASIDNLSSAELHKIFEEGKKKGWEEKGLGKFCKISSGGSAPQGKQFFKNGKYPFFRTFDVGAVHLSDNLCDVRDYLNDQGIKKLNLFKKGTILFPKSGASTFLNHRVIMGCDGYVASHLATISVGEEVNFKYLYYFLTLIDARDIAPNSFYPSLKILDIGKIKTPLPSLAEQKKIVVHLESLSQKIEETKELQNTTENEFDALERSILSKAFSGNLTS
jgi:type I restriction enzyme, S subunit